MSKDLPESALSSLEVLGQSRKVLRRSGSGFELGPPNSPLIVGILVALASVPLFWVLGFTPLPSWARTALSVFCAFFGLVIIAVHGVSQKFSSRARFDQRTGELSLIRAGSISECFPLRELVAIQLCFDRIASGPHRGQASDIYQLNLVRRKENGAIKRYGMMHSIIKAQGMKTAQRLAQRLELPVLDHAGPEHRKAAKVRAERA